MESSSLAAVAAARDGQTGLGQTNSAIASASADPAAARQHRGVPPRDDSNLDRQLCSCSSSAWLLRAVIPTATATATGIGTEECPSATRTAAAADARVTRRRHSPPRHRETGDAAGQHPPELTVGRSRSTAVGCGETLAAVADRLHQAPAHEVRGSAGERAVDGHEEPRLHC